MAWKQHGFEHRIVFFFFLKSLSTFEMSCQGTWVCQRQQPPHQQDTQRELCFIVKRARSTNWQEAGCWLSKCSLSSCYMLATWLNKHLFCQINILILKIVVAFISRNFGVQKSWFKVGRFCYCLSYMLLKKSLTWILLRELRQVETGQWLTLFGLYMREIKKFCMLWFIVLPKFRDWNLMANGRIVRNAVF